MVLYVCTNGKAFPAVHPCGRAAKALDDAGHAYEMKKVKGGRLKPWTLPERARDRAEVERLSGQRAVPILALDDGSVITGSATIARWAHEHAPADEPADEPTITPAAGEAPAEAAAQAPPS